jgi:O-antigen ligase
MTRPILAEAGLLLALCFFLPLFEAPKNILWLAYVATWLFNRVRSRHFGGRWDAWDSLIALWIASAFLVAVFAGLHGAEWKGVTDLVRYASILWMVMRSGYTARVLKLIAGVLVASTVVGLAFAHWQLLSGRGESGALQLHSVGHVNHTAIYLAIMLGVSAAWLFTRWNAWRTGKRAVGLAVTTLILVSLFVTASRGAIGIGLLLLPVLALAWWPRWRVPFTAAAATIILALAASHILGIEVLRKQERNVAGQNVLAFRDGIWRMGLVAWERYPWFGVGMNNYAAIDRQLVRQWRLEAGKGYDESKYVDFPHGHSLYVNTLTERGAVGAAALAAVLIAWLVWLIRFRPGAADADSDWLLWGSAASAWFVTIGVGTVNTTLHHEHGILATLLLAIWLCHLRQKRLGA